jgi:hypothetical protein
MASPSQSVKIGKKSATPEEKEKKTIFEHMADALGMQTIKLAQGQIPLFEKVKKIILSLSIYCAIGYVLGLILDMFLQSPYSLANIFALMMFIVWILRNGKKYLGKQL